MTAQKWHLVSCATVSLVLVLVGNVTVTWGLGASLGLPVRLKLPCEWPSGTHFHYAHAGRAGLNDRTYVLNQLTNLAATVNGTLCFPPPCESLVSFHNGGRDVPCGPGESWDDYTTIWPPTLPPGGEHQPLQVPVPPDSLWGCDGHWGSSLPVETGGPGQLGRRAVAVPNYYTWKCLVAVENLPRVVRVAYKTAPAVQLLRSLRITAKEQSSLLTANPEQPYEAYTPAGMPYYLLHIRRGNALKFQQDPNELIALNRTQTRFSQLEVDSVVQAVIRHNADHFKARFKGVATVTETATKLTLLFCTDETNTTYLAELVQRLRAIPWVERAIHLDPLLSKTQPHNYKVYAIEQALYRMQDPSRVQKLRRGDPMTWLLTEKGKKPRTLWHETVCASASDRLRLTLNQSLQLCTSPCPSPRHVILLHSPPGNGAGLEDRTNILTVLGAYAQVLCARVFVPKPCVMLGNHAGPDAKPLDCALNWTSYIDLSKAPGMVREWPETEVLLSPQETWRASQLEDPARASSSQLVSRLGLNGSYEVVVEDLAKGLGCVEKKNTACLLTFGFPQIWHHIKACGDKLRHKLVQSGCTKFHKVSHTYHDTYKDEFVGLVGSPASQQAASEILGELRQKTFSVLHLRRGDMLVNCDSNLENVRDFLQHKLFLNATRKKLRQCPSLLLFTDETDAAYIKEVLAVAQGLNAYIAHGDALVKAQLSKMDGILHPDSYLIYSVSNYIKEAAVESGGFVWKFRGYPRQPGRITDPACTKPHIRAGSLSSARRSDQQTKQSCTLD